MTGVEVVLSDGEVVTLGGDALDAPGYDLLGAFVGSEGTLGVATAITVRVVPAPEACQTMVAYFETHGRGPGRRSRDISRPASCRRPSR